MNTSAPTESGPSQEQLRQLALTARSMRYDVENRKFGIGKDGLPANAKPALLQETRENLAAVMGELALLQDKLSAVQDEEK